MFPNVIIKVLRKYELVSAQADVITAFAGMRIGMHTVDVPGKITVPEILYHQTADGALYP